MEQAHQATELSSPSFVSPSLPRGISNPTGTACHLTSVLVLLAYCLEPLRRAVLDWAATASDDDLIHTLGCLLRELETSHLGGGSSSCTPSGNTHHTTSISTSTTVAVDPTRVYQSIRQSIGVEAHELGDAVTALVKLLQYLRSITPTTAETTAISPQNNDCPISLHSPWECIWKDWIDAGRVHSVLSGEQLVSSPYNNNATHVINDEKPPSLAQQRRSKETKLRAMPVPFIVSAKEIPVWVSNRSQPLSLMDLVRQTLAPQVVEGYQWTSPIDDSHPDPSNDSGDNNNNNNNNECCYWRTTKTLHIDSIPPIWMIHLDRFVWHARGGGTVPALDSTIQIPAQLDVTELLCLSTTLTSSLANHPKNNNNPHAYHLVGGILHVQQDNNDDESPSLHDNENGAGHYVSIVLYLTQWFLLDDETVTQLSESRALELLGGSSVQDNCYMLGVLLVYHQTNHDDDDDTTMSFLRHKLKTMMNNCCQTDGSSSGGQLVDWTRPDGLVGRRLHVKWAKEKYYSGMVSAYNPTTGKHQVTYNDGDVRWYTLRKKTIEWEG